ncbi:hypothetical protein JTB14_030752 [Gonioctena quinquepunctata]|nr:hypothetical protein JTB14_030752 [Gonioctena quinquepunctata]
MLGFLMQTTVQKWLDEADSDVDDIRKDEDELVSEHDSKSEQSADYDYNKNPKDDFAEFVIVITMLSKMNVLKTMLLKLFQNNLEMKYTSDKENNNSPNSGTDDDGDDIPKLVQTIFSYTLRC